MNSTHSLNYLNFSNRKEEKISSFPPPHLRHPIKRKTSDVTMRSLPESVVGVRAFLKTYARICQTYSANTHTLIISEKLFQALCNRPESFSLLLPSIRPSGGVFIYYPTIPRASASSSSSGESVGRSRDGRAQKERDYI